ncbi:MAG TPA: hypothetical protein VK634_03045 [Reyranella sp.]|nr:hypothetical protein [Reyranella sp.]
MPFRTRYVVSTVAVLFVATSSVAQDGGPGDSTGQHGRGHAENHDWYQELKQPGTGYSCCNGTINGIEGDCRPTRAYLTEEGQWRALIDGQWVLIPPRAVLKQLAPDGRSHICASRSGMIYCFLGGSPKS